MTLLIDNTPIDFTLENETKLSEVISSLGNWLNKHQLIIETLHINSEDYSDKELKINLDTVEKIEIETISISELNINNLTLLIYFFENVNIAVKEWNIEILKQVKKESISILDTLPQYVSVDKDSDVYTDMVKLTFEKYDYFNCNESNVDKNEVYNLFGNILKLLNERIKEYKNPNEEIKLTITLLDSFRNDIESISMLLQSGKEDEAAAIMTKFTNIFQKLIRIINNNINNSEIMGDNNIGDFTKELNDILGELLEGYESQDVVLIGDILEYELSPKIEELAKMIG